VQCNATPVLGVDCIRVTKIPSVRMREREALLLVGETNISSVVLRYSCEMHCSSGVELWFRLCKSHPVKRSVVGRRTIGERTAPYSHSDVGTVKSHCTFQDFAISTDRSEDRVRFDCYRTPTEDVSMKE
jgi:hypothetical protein